MESPARARSHGTAAAELHDARRLARIVARLAQAPVALLALADGSAPGAAAAHGAPAEWGTGWEGALAAHLRARLPGGRGVLLLDRLADGDELGACGLRPPPAAVAAVPVVAAGGRVVGIAAALDLRARPWADDLAELLRDTLEMAGGALAVRAEPAAGEWRYRWLADGGGSVLLRGQPGGGTSEVPDPAGPALARILAPAEVTALREAAAEGEALRALRGVVDAVPVPVVGFDAEGRVTLWNPAAERSLGWSADEAVGRPWPLAHPGRWPEFEGFLRRALQGGGHASLEVFRRRKDGTPVEVSMTGAALRGRDGAACGVVAVLADVTERRAVDRDREQLLILEQAARARAERAERRSAVLAYASELLHAAFDYSPDELRVILGSLANLAVPTLADYCRIDQVCPDGTVERVAVVHTGPATPDAPESFPAGADPGVHPAVRVIRTGEPVLVPEVGRTELRELFAEPEGRGGLPAGVRSVLVVPLAARGRTLGALTLATAASRRRYDREDLLFAQDMARRIALELDNVRLYRKAENAARLRDEVLAIVSHDLRNPLNVISFSADVLLRGWLPETGRAAERRQVEGISLSADRMRRLIGDLLDVARVDAGRLPVEPTPDPAADLLLEALELHAPLAEEKRLLTRVRIPPDAPPVLADRDRVLQVLSNLLGNAIRHTPEGGTIVLSAETGEHEVRFAVSDTGPGIPDEHLPHIFDRFWRAQRARRGGAGLGLAIARGIVDAHGGTIWAESRVGEGSTFYFTLPRADVPPPPAPPM
jgi:PAS domain S-box-containing protein